MAMVGPDADPAECAALAIRGVTDVCCPPPITQRELGDKRDALRRTAARLGLRPRR
jgi:hypothetical protein